MYRRRNQKQAQAQPQPEVVDKKEEKKEEPVIKYVVKARGDALPDLGKAPMLNTLRTLDYFKSGITTYAVSEKILLDTILSPGYLSADFNEYRLDNGTGSSQLPYADEGSNDWNSLYIETTTYNRTTFAPGDLIIFETKDGEAVESVYHGMTFGFLIDKVYKADSTNGGFEEESRLRYTPPSPLGNPDTPTTDNMDTPVSSLSDCKGIVYMFNANTTLRSIAKYLSYSVAQEEGSEVYDQLRKLEPTNMSIPNGVDSTYNNSTTGDWGNVPSRKDEFSYIPPDGSRPKEVTGDDATHFNLTSGALVDGWLIYLTASDDLSASTADVTKANVAKITGDVVKTERVAITTIGNQILNLGNVFQIPYTLTNGVKYSGNNTKFASEPLNSEQYQVKYGDTVGERNLDIKMRGIFSLKKCCKKSDGSYIPGN